MKEPSISDSSEMLLKVSIFVDSNHFLLSCNMLIAEILFVQFAFYGLQKTIYQRFEFKSTFKIVY